MAKRATKRGIGKRGATKAPKRKAAGTTGRKIKRGPRKAGKAKKQKRGKRMRPGRGWRLTRGKNGNGAVFVATLMETINIGGQRLAIFSVPK